MRTFPRLLARRAACLSLLASLLLVCVARARDGVVDTQIHDDPKIPVAPIVRVLPQGLVKLWLQALARPENDLKRQAAAAIAQGRQRNVPGLEAAIAPLVQTLELPQVDLSVRLAAAQALIELDARQAAAQLFAHSRKDGIDMLNLVEPVLARWGYEPIKAVWLQRINQPGLAGRSWVVAMQGLAELQEVKAIPRLRELIFSPLTDPIIGVEAARALGVLQKSGLEQDAERLAALPVKPGDVAHLESAYLLRMHRSEDAARIQERLALRPESAAGLIALQGLVEFAPGKVLNILPELVKSRDPGIRSLGIAAFVRRPGVQYVAQIADLMNDPHPAVRTAARKSLAEIAQRAEFREAVQTQITRLLSGTQWRALEQAIYLVEYLRFQPATRQVVQLLQFERPEVFVAAAWCLRKLALPATYAAQLQEIDRRWQQAGTRDIRYPRRQVGEQLAQLCESMGQAKYAAAIPALERFLPKSTTKRVGSPARVAAIWSLGILQQKESPEKLVTDLVARLTDLEPLDPENTDVRTMCAISLGRMKAEAAADDLQSCFPRRMSTALLPNACGWALEQITGKPAPLADPVEAIESGWFLEPLRKDN
jgi:HEAT repeat protein